jgi:periplasmic copper chaperone A
MLKAIFLAAVLAVAGVAAAAAQAPVVEVAHAWARATPAGATTAGLYMTLVNKGTADDRLVSVTTPVAGVAQLHMTTTENGVMGMRPVAALEVKPGAPTVLRPGGYHVMLMDLKGPLLAGQSFAVSLTFEKGGRINVTAVVEEAGAMGPDTTSDMKM